MPILRTAAEFWWGPFLNGFCVHLTLPILLLAAALVLLTRAGRSIGIDRLFRHDQPRSQFLIGLSLGTLVWQLFLAGFLFEEFASNFSRDRRPFCESRLSEAWDVPFLAAGAPITGRPQPRFWIRPDSWRAVALYGLGVVLAMAATGLAGYLILLVAHRLIRGRFPYASYSRLPLPRLPGRWLWAGTLAGCLTYSGVSCLLFHVPPLGRAVAGIGAGLVELGGWGEGAGRRAAVALLANAHESQGQRNLSGDATAARSEGQTAVRRWLRPYYPVYGALTVGFVLYAAVFFLTFWVPAWRDEFTPASGIVFGAHLVLFSHVFVSYFMGSPTLVLLGLAAVLVIGGLPRHKFRFPGLEAAYERLADLDEFCRDLSEATGRQAWTTPDQQPTAEKNAADSREKLSQKRSPEVRPLLTSDVQLWNSAGRKRPLVILCTSGGGARACVWTMRVLLELERRFARIGANFPARVRLVSGASGGMIGAGLYVASLREPSAAEPERPVHKASPACSEAARLRRQRLGWDAATWDEWSLGAIDDFLTPVAGQLMRRDLWSPLVPRPLRRDRGHSIEEAWSRSMCQMLDVPFRDLAAGEAAGWRPSLVYSPMIVEDGRQLVISNLDFDRVIQNRAAAGTSHNVLLSRGGVEFFRLLPHASGFRLATAARMSATFPYVLPAVELPTDPPLRVVDAGYFDGFGVSLAMAWLWEYREWIRENVSGVAVIQIRDGASKSRRRMEVGAYRARPLDLSRSFAWLTSPLDGLFSARHAATYRNDTLLAWVDRYFNEPREARPAGETLGQGTSRDLFLTTASLELASGDEVALSFSLSDDELRTIEAAAAPTNRFFHAEIDDLVNWWQKRDGAG